MIDAVRKELRALVDRVQAETMQQPPHGRTYTEQVDQVTQRVTGLAIRAYAREVSERIPRAAK